MNPPSTPKVVLLLVGFLCVTLQSGCVTGRRSVALQITPVPQSSTAKGDLAIGSVVDQRRFENKPRDPSTPSVDGDVAALSEKERASMIGRQRNTYGKALGDVALPADDSVLQRARVLVGEAFKRRDYKITTGPASAAASVDIAVNEFWGWSTPGMFSIAFEARVSCTVTFKRDGEPKTLKASGVGRNQAQVASDPNWQLAYSRAFEDFILNLHREMERAGL